jgi:hypothetical protein
MILTEIDLGYSPIPAGCMRRLDEVTVKRDGHVWRIHRNDADSFPSHPHAHNVESGLKLDLTTGNLYLGTQFTKKAVHRKDLLAIREQAAARGIDLPPLAV